MGRDCLRLTAEPRHLARSRVHSTEPPGSPRLAGPAVKPSARVLIPPTLFTSGGATGGWGGIVSASRRSPAISHARACILRNRPAHQGSPDPRSNPLPGFSSLPHFSLREAPLADGEGLSPPHGGAPPSRTLARAFYGTARLTKARRTRGQTLCPGSHPSHTFHFGRRHWPIGGTSGGWGGIRTLGTREGDNRFPGDPVRPLRHPSEVQKTSLINAASPADCNFFSDPDHHHDALTRRRVSLSLPALDTGSKWPNSALHPGTPPPRRILITHL